MALWDTAKKWGETALNVGTMGAYGAVKKQGPFTQKPIEAYDPNSEMFDTTMADRGRQGATSAENRATLAATNAQGREFVDPAQAEAARAQQMQGLTRVNQFIDQGPGPSMAEAQLQQAQSRNMADAVSLARSGRGATGSAAAMRAAQAQKARISSDTATGLAQVRANEFAQRQAQRLSAMGLAQSSLAGVRGADQAQQGMALNQAQVNDAFATNQGQLGLGYANLSRGFNQDEMNARMAEEELRSRNIMAARTGMAESDAQRDAALIGSVGALGGAAIAKSDRDAKTDIEDIKGILDTAKNAKPYKYKYKDERDGKGEFVGPMAQDLEKTPLGNTLVRKVGGERYVDGARSGMLALSALGEQQKEIERIKKLLDKGKRAA